MNQIHRKGHLLSPLFLFNSLMVGSPLMAQTPESNRQHSLLQIWKPSPAYLQLAPGKQRKRILHDSDGDGWCDLWMNLVGLKRPPANPNEDLDQDGFSSYEEMLLWRDPAQAEIERRPLNPFEARQAEIRRIQSLPKRSSKEMAGPLRAYREFKTDLQNGFPTAKQKEVRRKRQETLTKLAQALSAKEHPRLEEARRAHRSNPRRNGLLFRGAGADGHPRYFNLDGDVQALSHKVEKIWPGGTNPFPDVTGNNVSVLGIWDDGGVHLNHREFQNRASLGEPASEIESEGDFEIGPHATEVAGVMIAGGVSPPAIGIAFEADLTSYGSFDDYHEMTLAAGAGMLFSNHSYGPRAGWDGNSDLWLGPPLIDGEDPEFGAYTSDSKNIDAITYFAPRFLSVWSSGNETTHEGVAGTDLNFIVLNLDPESPEWDIAVALNHPKDGGEPLPGAFQPPNNEGPIPGPGYDTIRSTGCAKNNLTVGNIESVPTGINSSSDLEIFLSSSRGPTDDGRVKPDLVADGDFVRVPTYSGSPSNITLGTRVSGTSASAPCITGTLGLLHQLNEEAGRAPFLASTWKALLLNTAIDGTSLPAYLGTAAANANLAGPDYFYGWGACDADAAATLIGKNFQSGNGQIHLAEHVLFDDHVIEIPICHDGESPEMKVMICWTDVPYQTAPTGTPSSEVQDPEQDTADDPTPRLVNDLDLQVIAPDGTVLRSWILDPANPLSPAIPGYETLVNGQPEVIDNTTDNVEQVIIPAPVAGNYTVRISHKGDLKAMTQPSEGVYHLASDQQQAVSICISGNKDPMPRLPRLRFERIDEVQIGGTPYYEIRFRLDGFLGVHYQLQRSPDLINWFDYDDEIDDPAVDLALAPVLTPQSESSHFYRVRAISPE